MHGSAGATSQGHWNRMFRGCWCSSIEMLKGSCSFSLLSGVKGFNGLADGGERGLKKKKVARTYVG